MTTRRTRVGAGESAEAVGWIIGNAREHGAPETRTTAARFAELVDPPVHRAQIGRWESGRTAITHQQVRQYESVLGLPEGYLLAMIDTVTRERYRSRPGPHLPGPTSPAWWQETDDLIEKAFSEDRMTGLEWSTLSAALGARPDAFLRRRDWERLLRRCTVEADLCTGLDYVQRDEAKMRLASHPRMGPTLRAMADEVLSDPVAPTYSETVVLLGVAPTAETVALLRRHLEDPVSEPALYTVLWALRRLADDHVLEGVAAVDVGQRALDLVRDPSTSGRVARAAAVLLHGIDLPEREAVVAGLRGGPRRRIAEVIDRGSPLQSDEVTRMAQEIERRLVHEFNVQGRLKPTLRALLAIIAGQTSESGRGSALTLLMLAPQGPVVGGRYAAALRHAVAAGADVLVEEALPVLSWLLPPEDVPTLLDLALDRAASGTQSLQAANAVANCRPATWAPGTTAGGSLRGRDRRAVRAFGGRPHRPPGAGRGLRDARPSLRAGHARPVRPRRAGG